MFHLRAHSTIATTRKSIKRYQGRSLTICYSLIERYSVVLENDVTLHTFTTHTIDES